MISKENLKESDTSKSISSVFLFFWAVRACDLKFAFLNFQELELTSLSDTSRRPKSLSTIGWNFFFVDQNFRPL